MPGSSACNSLRPSDAYMQQMTRPSLVQIMAWCWTSTKPLSELMMTYCQLDHKEHISMKYYLKFVSFPSRKCMWNYRLQNGGHFVQASICQHTKIITKSAIPLAHPSSSTAADPAPIFGCLSPECLPASHQQSIISDKNRSICKSLDTVGVGPS